MGFGLQFPEPKASALPMSYANSFDRPSFFVRQYPDYYFTPEVHQQPPPEESLYQNSLWPELQKLYGHGYEIFSLASDGAGKLIASACKAAKAEHAQVSWGKVKVSFDSEFFSVFLLRFFGFHTKSSTRRLSLPDLGMVER